MKLIARALALVLLSSVPAFGEEPTAAPRTYTLTQQQAQDYVARLSAEIRQLSAQYESDKASLDALMAQDKPKGDDAKLSTEDEK